MRGDRYKKSLFGIDINKYPSGESKGFGATTKMFNSSSHARAALRAKSTIIIAIAIFAIAVAFLLSSAILPVPNVPGDGLLGPELDVECRGPWNNKVLTQIELDGVLAQHKAFLARLPTFTPSRTQPYEPVKAYSAASDSHPAGTASALPPSTSGLLLTPDQTGRADLCGARIIGLDMRNADLRYARLMSAKFERVQFAGSDLRWTNARESTLQP
jgi:hypothetical protein